MVIAVRDGIFNVWRMYQHTVRKYLLLKEKHFLGYIFPSVALVDLHARTLSWAGWIFHGELNVDPCGILPSYSDICSLTNETVGFWAVQKRRYRGEHVGGWLGINFNPKSWAGPAVLLWLDAYSPLKTTSEKVHAVENSQTSMEKWEKANDERTQSQELRHCVMRKD